MTDRCLCPVCLRDYEAWPLCELPDCHDGHLPPLYITPEGLVYGTLKCGHLPRLVSSKPRAAGVLRGGCIAVLMELVAGLILAGLIYAAYYG